MKLICLNILSLLFLKHFTAGLEFVPPSREIEVIESDEYTFGLKEDDTTNITRCNYTTNTGIVGYFDVAKRGPPPPPPSPDSFYELDQTKHQPTTFDQIKHQPTTLALNYLATKVTHNEITHWGNIGDCKMTIKYVDEKGPTQWTLTPFNNKTGETPGNLPPVTFTVNFFYKVPIITKETVSLFESSSFFQYLNVTKIKFQSCQLKFGTTTMDLDLNSPAVNMFIAPYSVKNEKTVNKVSSLGHGLCGFKVKNMTQAETLEWTLTGTDDQGKKHRTVFKTVVHKKLAPGVLNTKHLINIGKSASIICGCKYDQEYCHLYDPSGNYVFTSDNDCHNPIRSVGMNDLGVWKCITGYKRTMEEVTYTVELIAKTEEPVTTWMNETSDYINVGCQLTNTYRKDGISLCKMISPNKHEFILQPGSATDRYLAFGTDLTQAICAIEIPKPLQDHEKGLWRCEVYLGGSPTGGYINVGKARLPTYKRHFKMTKQLNDKLMIQCEVPFTSEYCHIKTPDGTIHPARNNDEEARLGKCSFNVEKVNATHNGTWTCSFAREIGVPDEEIFVEVTVAEVLHYYKTVEVYADSSAQLICSTGGLPLTYCRFITPNGKAYHIPNHQRSQFLSYYGKGLEYGECGITISHAQPADSGYWTCVARISSGYSEIETTAKILLDVTPGLFDDPNIAAAIGIAIGVVVVSSFAGFVAVRRWRRRQHVEVAGTSTASRRVNDDDNSENLDIFNMAPLPHSYTNPEAVRDDTHQHQL